MSSPPWSNGPPELFPATAAGPGSAAVAWPVSGDPLDRAAVEALRRDCAETGDPGLFGTLVTMFLEGAGAQLGTIRASLSAADAPALAHAAHTLRGNAATLGAERVRELSERLEALASAGDLAAAAEPVERLEEELERARAALGAELER